jgi:DNA-binding XRE family transcriptional regulator
MRLSAGSATTLTSHSRSPVAASDADRLAASRREAHTLPSVRATVVRIHGGGPLCWARACPDKLRTVPASGPRAAAVFAANVKRLREKRRLTMEQAAGSVGMHHTAWGRIESGERKPTLETVFKLAQALDVPPAELFARID